MSTAFQLACLDMAGTTVSDDGVVGEAFARALGEVGIDPLSARYHDAIDYVAQTMGQSKLVVFNALFPQEASTARTANQAFEAAYQALLLDDRVAPLPGAEEAIESLRERGVKVCLTTGFSPATRDALIDAVGWRGRIDLALSPADAGRGRPYPDMILTAVIRLGIDDVAAVAVAGDTASDLLAGHRSGASVVAGVLTGAHDKDTLSAAPHTHLLATIADLPAVLFPLSPSPIATKKEPSHQ
jgi:phosphoglycolate phosphatase